MINKSFQFDNIARNLSSGSFPPEQWPTLHSVYTVNITFGLVIHNDLARPVETSFIIYIHSKGGQTICYFSLYTAFLFSKRPDPLTSCVFGHYINTYRSLFVNTEHTLIGNSDQVDWPNINQSSCK